MYQNLTQNSRWPAQIFHAVNNFSESEVQKTVLLSSEKFDKKKKLVKVVIFVCQNLKGSQFREIHSIQFWKLFPLVNVIKL